MMFFDCASYTHETEVSYSYYPDLGGILAASSELKLIASEGLGIASCVFDFLVLFSADNSALDLSVFI